MGSSDDVCSDGSSDDVCSGVGQANSAMRAHMHMRALPCPLSTPARTHFKPAAAGIVLLKAVGVVVLGFCLTLAFTGAVAVSIRRCTNTEIDGSAPYTHKPVAFGR